MVATTAVARTKHSSISGPTRTLLSRRSPSATRLPICGGVLAQLPDAQREVITLAYFGELSTTEISGELSLPLGTVKGRMRLGLEKLRREIDQN